MRSQEKSADRFAARTPAGGSLQRSPDPL